MKKIFFALVILLPSVTFAAAGGLGSLLSALISLVEMLIPIVSALALLYFFWGVAEYVRSIGDSGKTEGKSKMLWGIIALFVMFSVWGLVSFVSSDLLGIRPNTSSGSYASGQGNTKASSKYPCYDNRQNPSVTINPDGSKTVTIGNKDLDPCKQDATDQLINLAFWPLEKGFDMTKWSATKIKEGATGAFNWATDIFKDEKKTETPPISTEPTTQNTTPQEEAPNTNGTVDEIEGSITDDVIDDEVEEEVYEEDDYLVPDDGWYGIED